MSMTIGELQDWVTKSWDENPLPSPAVELQLLYIMEELGEVAEAIRKNGGNKNRTNEGSDLGSEIADLIISITTLANTFGVDITKEVQLFQERLEKRARNK